VKVEFLDDLGVFVLTGKQKDVQRFQELIQQSRRDKEGRRGARAQQGNAADKSGPEMHARAQIKLLVQAIKLYRVDNGGCPSTSQGLEALVSMPANLPQPSSWMGPYLEAATVPLDPWDHPYQYQLIGADTFRISSAGPDGVHGTVDDVTN
jgi:general secretion pathway protein G